MSDAYIGVDIGGTKVAVAVLREGRLGDHGIKPTEIAAPDALIDEICALVDSVRSDDVRGVGVGVPSVVDYDAGRIRTSVNVPLADLPLRSVLEERIGLPVFLDNDATVAALAEASSDAEIDVANLVMFTVGTGVGGGIVLNGAPYRGTTGAAAELGHMMVAAARGGEAPPPGSFPQDGSLESLAAGTTLDELAVAAAGRHPESAVGRARTAGEVVDGHLVVTAAQDGDEVAIGLLAAIGSWLGIGVANMINALDPDVVAIGGGVSVAGELLLEPVRRTAREYILPGVGTDTEIRLSKHGPTAGVLGAAILAKVEMKGREEAR